MTYSKVHLFADDTNLLFTNSSLKKLNSSVNLDLKNLCVWLRANKISLNAKKTELILFKNRQKKITKNLNFRLSGQKINPSKSIKYLGVTIDEHLTWNHHINNLASTLSRANGMLCKIRHFVPYPTLISIYYSIFNSHLSFGNQIWGQNKNRHTDRITKLQNKAVRIINFSNFRDSAILSYAHSRILKMHDQIFMKNCLLIQDHSKNSLPNPINHFFKKLDNIHTYNTRSQSNHHYFQIINRTDYSLKSISNRAVLDWNSLSRKLSSGINVLNVSRNQLRSYIRKYIFSTYV